jgi:hypothetical protein
MSTNVRRYGLLAKAVLGRGLYLVVVIVLFTVFTKVFNR